MKILGIYPLYGNGGIASWTKKFLLTFPCEDYYIKALPSGSKKDFTKYKNSLDRAFHGLVSLIKLVILIIREFRKDHYDIVHITTSAGMSVIRDMVVAYIAHSYNAKVVMHCRFGTIKELYESKSVWGFVFRKNIKIYDQVWVLDNKSFKFLCSICDSNSKIKLTPNSIEVPKYCNLSPKDYCRVGFVGNIIETKGIFELVKAVIKKDIKMKLIIAGPGSDSNINQLKSLAGEEFGQKVEYKGKLSNEDAVRLIESLDVLALPTYYPGEAFPISIIESMSRGKLVLSCPRAAIPDMLTDLNGEYCGILVEERSIDAIYNALRWICSHKEECDKMCIKAYEKVKNTYNLDIVYNTYKNNFSEIMNS